MWSENLVTWYKFAFDVNVMLNFSNINTQKNTLVCGLVSSYYISQFGDMNGSIWNDIFWTANKDMKVEMILAMAWNDRHSGLLSSSLMDRALRPLFAKVRPVRFPFGIFPVSGSFPPSYFVTGQVNMRSPFQTNHGFIIIIIIVVVIFVKVFVDETFVFSWFFEKATL